MLFPYCPRSKCAIRADFGGLSQIRGTLRLNRISLEGLWLLERFGIVSETETAHGAMLFVGGSVSAPPVSLADVREASLIGPGWTSSPSC